MRQGMFVFLGGILLVQGLPQLPLQETVRWSSAWALILLGIILLLIIRVSPLWRLPLWFAAGSLWALWHAGTGLATALPPALEGRDLRVTGVIEGIPRRSEDGVRFFLRVERFEDAPGFTDLPQRLRLSWYGRRVPALVAGERWRFTVRLKRPRGFMNPGGFDYEGWLFRQGVRATGYVRAGAGHERLAPPPSWPVSSWSLRWSLDRLRQALYREIDTRLAGWELRGLVAALAMGERQGIQEHHWQVLRGTGTTHLMAISGLHVGMVAGLAFWLVRWGWSRVPALSLYLAAPRAAAVAALLAAGVYAALAGFSVPTQRALIMVGVAMVSWFFQTRWRPGDVLALALWGVLWWDPLSVLSAGLWLSFAAVAGILFAMGGRPAARGAWWRWGRLHWVAALGVAPLSLWFFHQQALAAPLANFLAVPWVGLLVVPCALLGAVLLPLWPAAGEVLLQAAVLCLSGLWPVLEAMAAWPGAQWFHAPPAWGLAVAVVAVLLCLAPRGLPGRWLGVLGLLPLVLPLQPRPAEGELWFTLLDVGQGLAAVAQTREHVLVYDTGPRYSDRFDAGSAVLVPFLRSRGIRRVDLLVLGHGDRDHSGGAATLLAALPVARILASAPARVPPAAGWEGPPPAPCRAGQHWRWNGISFHMLHPQPVSDLRGNDASCVLRIRAGRHAVLLPGDIERRGERALLRHHRAGLASQILVVPHHGSRTSSTPAFVAAVRPDYALFAVGYRNRYRLPAAAVVQRYRAQGSRLLDSARHGAMHFRLGGTGELPAPQLYRSMARRYWHGD